MLPSQNVYTTRRPEREKKAAQCRFILYHSTNTNEHTHNISISAPQKKTVSKIVSIHLSCGTASQLRENHIMYIYCWPYDKLFMYPLV
jgi:hypothetical protein